MKQNIRWLFWAFVFTEILINYLKINWLVLPLKPIGTVILFIYYYAERRNQLSSKDKLMLFSLVFTICGEFAFHYRHTSVGIVLILVFYMIEHQLYIAAFREEKAMINNLSSWRNFLPIMPFILISFLFFGFLLMPKVSDVLFPFVLFYSFQTAILGALAVFRPVPYESYRLIILAILVNILSDAITSLRLFEIIKPFAADYFLIMSSFMLAKYLFVTGMLASKNQPIVQE